MTDHRGGYPGWDRDREAQHYRDRGEKPPWEKIWADGEDVTDKPELWPEPIPRGRSRRYRKKR